MEGIIETLRREFRPLATHFPYEVEQGKQLVAVTGLRSPALHQLAHRVVKGGVSRERLLYLNFEDDRLEPYSMRQLIDAWYERYGQNERCFLFLEHVDRLDVWPLVVRKLLDTKNVVIYISATSNKLMMHEMAAPLRSRAQVIEVLPLMAAKDRKSFLQFLVEPERINEKVILHDMVERHQISNVPLLKYFIHYLMKNVCHPISINKFFLDIKSQGYKAGKDTLHAYLAYLEEAYFIYTVPLFSELPHKIETSPKKIYAGATGLITGNSFHYSMGKLFENQVYLELRRQGKKVFYYQTKKGDPVDFIVQEESGECEIIQTAFDAEALEFKTNALERAKRELGFTGTLFDFSRSICMNLL